MTPTDWAMTPADWAITHSDWIMALADWVAALESCPEFQDLLALELDAFHQLVVQPQLRWLAGRDRFMFDRLGVLAQARIGVSDRVVRPVRSLGGRGVRRGDILTGSVGCEPARGAPGRSVRCWLRTDSCLLYTSPSPRDS
eukprot:TRINITY_DN20562_c0_g1_i2.p2 TRINITY_DN20562_c0_g1~~TRINITY_DN20562_c0_g1_i2.p2  ORF type:complete len:141 (+),score=19.10 TRINITY_DN20562_c0_g1_i2:659-1081(+)